MDDTANHQEHSHSGTVTVEKQQQQQRCIDFERLEKLSGFPNHCNGAEGIHNFGDPCKYEHVLQAKGGTVANLGTHPTLETNK